jgi:hypothetical protein
MSTERTDAMAAHRATQQLRDLLSTVDALGGVIECECGEKLERYLDDDGEEIAEAVVDQFAVHFERRVNGNDVAVRRVVMYGPEEVDPNPPADGACPNCAPGYDCHRAVYEPDNEPGLRPIEAVTVAGSVL